MSNYATSRRAFMMGLPAAGAALSLAPYSPPALAMPGEGHRFVSLYFNGGWDVLLSLDPRDPLSNPAGIDLGTDDLAAGYREPSAWDFGGQEHLIGPSMVDLFEHRDVMTIFRGVNMNTVAHPTGRAYVNTWIPPTGVVPKGDSIGTRMAAGADHENFLLPNVSIGMPSFNHSFAPEVSGIGMGQSTDATNLVEPVSTPFSAETTALLQQARAASSSCVGAGYSDAPGPKLDIARARVQELLGLELGAAFDFVSDEALTQRYIINNPQNGREAGVVAATVWRLLDLGLTTSISAQLQAGLDTHDTTWATNHGPRQRTGFRSIAALLTDLRQTDPMLNNTTVIAHSEFARTPRINGRGGRDHWFANSVLVFGGGLRSGVFGATTPDSLGLAAVNLQTGLPDEAGEVIRPEHIGATLAHAKGLPYEDFRVEPLNAWIA